jgi:hypothetical protein
MGQTFVQYFYSLLLSPALELFGKLELSIPVPISKNWTGTR